MAIISLITIIFTVGAVLEEVPRAQVVRVVRVGKAISILCAVCKLYN